ncbi:MAG: immunoglobulin-like domain-containing protein [Candidatus Izemoplasmataceae bacterium]
MLKVLMTTSIFLLLTACNLSEEEASPQSLLEEAETTIQVPENVQDGDTLDLPGSYEDISIEWTSSDPEIINDQGEVLLEGIESKTVELEAVYELDGEALTESYTVTVEPSDEAYVDHAMESLDLPRRTIYEKKYSFPESVDGVELDWESSHPEYLDNEGQTTLPEEGDEVEVTMTVTLSLNEVEKTRTLSTIVTHYEPLHSPEETELVRPVDAPVHRDAIADEVDPPEGSRCFPGAWYNKAVSSEDAWLGIEGVITLPEVNLSDNRYDYEDGRYLDNPSIYLGGNAGAESDVGLSWMPACNNAYCLSPGDQSVTFRPFWRYIHNGSNTWENASYQNPEHYYFPGDKLRMTVFSPEPGYLQMEIEVIEPTDIPEYVELRASLRIKDNMPSNFVTPKFPSSGHGSEDAEFKRVNAIDQVGNEGTAAEPTDSEVNKAIWHEVYLYRNIDNELKKVPFTRERFDSMLCPDSDGFVLDYDHEEVDEALGGEAIWIQPKKAEDYEK